MNNQQLIKGLVLMAVALLFGLPSLEYRMGNFTRPGPGLFPLIVSGILLLIGIAIVLRSRFVERKPMDFKLKNIALIMLSLCGFALLSEKVDMLAGILFLVFVSGVAATTYSLVRNLKIAAGLVAIAFVLEHFLGLNLHLFT
ncbi:MAG: tripartite tricarboxylate transporter TctB family protein [Paucibacter sp.]|nr:tripartite tricarboxylate transporter TctB family protein [Roseateles sp.]